MIHVCIKCRDRAKGCTLITEDGERLPLVCVLKETRKAITCEWREVPKKEEDYNVRWTPEKKKEFAEKLDKIIFA